MKKCTGMISALLLVCSLGMFYACSVKDGEEPGEMGMIVLRIDSGSLQPLTVVPEVSMEVDHYVVIGTGPGTWSFQETVEEDSVLLPGIAVGSWTLEVEAWNDEEPSVKIGYGMTGAPVEVRVGEVTMATVTVYPLQGDGKLSIYLSWPGGAVESPEVEGELEDSVGDPATDSGDNPVSLVFVVDAGAGTAVSENNVVEAGYYLLTLRLKEGEELLWMQPVAVRILAVDDPATEVRINLVAEDIMGTIGLTITEELQDPIEIGFEGQREAMTPEQMMTVGAETTVGGEAVAVDRYRWYVHGEVRSEEETVDIYGSEHPDAQGAGYGYGRYRVDLVVWKDEIISSEYFHFEVTSQNLSLTVYESIFVKNPVEGVIVFVNDKDDNSLIGWTTTDQDGHAVLDTGSRDRVTFGYGFEGQFGPQVMRIVQTMHDIPCGDGVAYLRYEQDEEYEGTIDVQLTNLPMSYDHTDLQPFWDWRGSMESGFHDNVEVYGDCLQKDGTISMLGCATEMAGNRRYGYLLDQTFTDNGFYSIPLSVENSTYATYTTNREVLSLDAVASRKGVRFYLGGYGDMMGIPFTMASFSIMDQFPLSADPLDTYFIEASMGEDVGEDRTGFYHRDFLSSLPSSHFIDIRDYRITSASLNPTTETISWTATGDDSTLDISRIQVEHFYTDGMTDYMVMWFLITDRGNCSVTAPEVPPPMTGWLDFQSISESGGHYYLNGEEVYTRVNSSDFEGISGLDELVEAFFVEDVLISLDPIFTADYDIPRRPDY
jgi:hypothetical protein